MAPGAKPGDGMDGTANLDVHTLGIIGLAVGATIALSFTLLSMVLRGMLALHIWAGAFWLLYVAVRFEKHPLPFILLAFLPYGFLGYYFERVRPNKHKTRDSFPMS